MPVGNPVDPRSFVGVRLNNGLAPTERPKCLAVPLAMNNNAFAIDLQSVIDEARLSFVQSIFVDNSANASELVISVSITGQVLKVAANSQAYLPVLAADSSKYVVSSAGTAAVTIFFCNMPMPAISWGGLT